MSATTRKRMTLEEFLAWDAGQEDRWEFDGFGPVAMVGGTRAHSLVTTNLIIALGNRLKGTPCRVHNDSLQLRVAGSVRYPDVFVECGGGPASGIFALNPVVVFEVLSPSTASTDQIVKGAEYRATASIRRYVMLAQDKMAANVLERRGEDWLSTSVIGGGSVLDMPEIGVSLPLAELYDGVLDAG